MEMVLLENNPQIETLNEMVLQVQDSLPTKIENSIYYPKLKALMHPEIVNFCKEQIELKGDLNMLRMNIGQALSESEIREYMDNLCNKYNGPESKIAIAYHIEVTRIDYGVPVFCVIQRGNKILMKKLVFRFRKQSVDQGLLGLSIGGIPLDALKKDEGGK